MDPVLGRRLALELGVTPDKVNRLRQVPFEQAVKDLEELKVAARTNYRKLAFKYHPDRNPGNVEAETAFKTLGEVLKHIELLRMQRPQPMPTQRLIVHFNVPVNVQVRQAPSYTSTTATTSTYDARQVAYIRVV